VLCGCSGHAEDAAPAGATGATLSLPATSPSASAATPSHTATSSSASASAVLDDGGNVVESLGQQAGIRTPDGKQAVLFSVDAVVVDPRCTGSQQQLAPVNGHYLAVHVRVTTGDLDFLGGRWSMTAQDFGVRGADGVTRFDVADQGAMNCLDDPDRFPTTALGPGQQEVGTIVLDSPTTTGTLVFSPPDLQGTSWKWQF
jgi:hypothetical protein